VRDGTDWADRFAGVAADADFRVNQVLLDQRRFGAHVIGSLVFLRFLFVVCVVRSGTAWVCVVRNGMAVGGAPHTGVPEIGTRPTAIPSLSACFNITSLLAP
jgi:hypothetical protein